MVMYLAAWPTLSMFHKADLSKSFYNGAEEYERLLSDMEIDVIQPVRPF